MRPGDGIDLQNLPGSDDGGLLAAAASAAAAVLGGGGGGPAWRAVRVRHVLDGARGFVSVLELEGGEAAAAGGGLLGGLA